MPEFDFFKWVVVPVLIILARIADQSIGTLRIVYLGKGYKFLAPLIGFFEVLIWLIAVRQIFQHLDNYLYFISYALGFALGNYIGLKLEEKISLGLVVIRVFPKQKFQEILIDLQQHQFGLTVIDGHGTRGPVKIIFSILPRKKVNEFIHIINKYDYEAFYTIEEVKSASHGIFPQDIKPRRKFLGIIALK